MNFLAPFAAFITIGQFVAKVYRWITNKLITEKKKPNDKPDDTVKELLDIVNRAEDDIAHANSQGDYGANFANNMKNALCDIHACYDHSMSADVHGRVAKLAILIINISKEKEQSSDSAAIIGFPLSHVIAKLPDRLFTRIVTRYSPKPEFPTWGPRKLPFPSKTHATMLNSVLMVVIGKRKGAKEHEASLYDTFLAYTALGPWGQHAALGALLSNSSIYAFPILSQLWCEAIRPDERPDSSDPTDHRTGHEPQKHPGKLHDIFEYFSDFVSKHKGEPIMPPYLNLVLSLKCLPPSLGESLLNIHPQRPFTVA